MALTIVVRAGASDTDVSPLSLTFDAPRVVIGRGDGCDVRLPDPSVSHRHASIRQRGSELLIVDEGSTNGTFFGQVKLAPQSPRVIRSGDLLRIGRVWLEVKLELVPVPPQAAQLAERLALELVVRALAAQGEDARARITVVEGPDAGKALVLDDPSRRYVLGRGTGADLLLDDPRASRRHVEVGTRGKEIVARDLGAQDAASLDGSLLAQTDTIWRPGKTLALSDDRFTLAHPAAEALVELERGPDEPMRPDEDVAPPETPAPEEAAQLTPSAPVTSPSAPMRPFGEAARDEALEVEEGGWGLTDAAVVLAAVGVLAISVVGLVWLLQ